MGFCSLVASVLVPQGRGLRGVEQPHQHAGQQHPAQAPRDHHKAGEDLHLDPTHRPRLRLGRAPEARPEQHGRRDHRPQEDDGEGGAQSPGPFHVLESGEHQEGEHDEHGVSDEGRELDLEAQNGQLQQHAVHEVNHCGRHEGRDDVQLLHRDVLLVQGFFCRVLETTVEDPVTLLRLDGVCLV